MEYGFKDCQLFVSLAAYLTQVAEGNKRIFNVDNFYGKLTKYELAIPDKIGVL